MLIEEYGFEINKKPTKVSACRELEDVKNSCYLISQTT